MKAIPKVFQTEKSQIICFFFSFVWHLHSYLHDFFHTLNIILISFMKSCACLDLRAIFCTHQDLRLSTDLRMPLWYLVSHPIAFLHCPKSKILKIVISDKVRISLFRYLNGLGRFLCSRILLHRWAFHPFWIWLNTLSLQSQWFAIIW